MDEEQIQQMINELLGKLSIGGGAGAGVQSLLDSPISPGSTSYNSLMGEGGDDGFLPGVSATDAQLGAGGDTGFETPAMRDAAIKAYQGGLLPGTPAYREFMLSLGANMGGDTFDVGLGIDGNEEGYTFTGDGGLSEVGMAQFRDRNNIQPALGGGMDSSNLGFAADPIADLSSDFVGGFDRGLDNPAQRHSIGEIMGNLDPQEQMKVKQIIQSMNDGTEEGRIRQQTFLNGLMDGNIDAGGYEVQNQYRLGY